MTQPTSNDQPDNPEKALVVNPINMARARHASTLGESALHKTRQVAAILHGERPSSQTKIAPQDPPGMVDKAGNCLLVVLMGLVFLVGGIVGGVAGGSFMLWASSSGELTWLSNTPTPTPLPTPTPAPVATATPTLTPEPIRTPSPEDIIAQVSPSVVTVLNQQPSSLVLTPDEGRVAGSGVIIDARGYIATNHHVVENTGNLSVILADGRELPATLIASEPADDLAVIKIEVTNLPTIHWGDSASVRPGQNVYAIGSPLGDFPNSVSFGIVSGLNRALEINEFVIDGLIQTDAAINRGSSGGPLINSRGEMIGINTFIIRESETRGVTEGIAFAIPTNTARNLLTTWITADTGGPVPIPASGESGN